MHNSSSGTPNGGLSLQKAIKKRKGKKKKSRQSSPKKLVPRIISAKNVTKTQKETNEP